MRREFPAHNADERTTLEAWLDFHRDTLARKCEGLSPEQLRERATPPSPISLIGLVRHMAEVERSWFQRRLDGRDVPYLYVTETDEDADFHDVDTADLDADFAAWREQCAAAREVLSRVETLDRTFDWHGRTVSVRWLLVHIIEEYARHAGHADLIRERLDGSTGL